MADKTLFTSTAVWRIPALVLWMIVADCQLKLDPKATALSTVVENSFGYRRDIPVL